ncbi:MAG: S8 family peptidase, partial [Flavisolibacter sp.]
FGDIYRAPKEELTTGTLDLSLNRINLVHNKFPFINGDSIFASIKEQRFDTSDIDIKGRYFDSRVAAATVSSHASIMATMLAGAGNTSPFARGAALGSYVTSSDFANLLPDPDSVYRNYKISIQNHSYGTAIENYYGADAAAFDQSMKNNPSLLHVFSSGNSGAGTSTSGTYTGIQEFANITGSFKMAKNIITVGATDSFNHVVGPSSKGPAYDGRVKPELVAFGQDGSSGAAALVSGTVALVQQSYRSLYNVIPSNALTKSVILNSADDVERPQIDYSSGYGALNAYNAVNTVFQNRFLEGLVSQNEVKSFNVTVPPNIARAKFTLVWMDTPAPANASKALVNDLDAQLQFPSSGQVWLPWVLSIVPNRDSLVVNATRKIDTLNTVEQITVDFPDSGNYSFKVIGSRIQQGPSQLFAVAYQFDTINHFVWTYPSSTDAMAASAKYVIRWQTTISGTGTIEYSLDRLQWQTVADVNLNDGYYTWITPDTSSIAFLRMKLSGGPSTFMSDSFTVSRVMNLKVGFNCADSFLLYWNRLPVSQYLLYGLGEKYLQPMMTLADTSIVLSKQRWTSLNYAVAPLLNSKTGLRSFTTNYTTQGVGCYFESFLALLQNNIAQLNVLLGTVYNISSITIMRTNSRGTTTIQTLAPPLTTSFSVTDSNLVRGVNKYQLAIHLIDGSTIYSEVETLYYFPDLPVIAYPNPVRQNEPLTIISETPGDYSITFYDASGRMTLTRRLDDVYQQLLTLRLAKGVYFMKVISQSGASFMQKIIVY